MRSRAIFVATAAMALCASSAIAASLSDSEARRTIEASLTGTQLGAAALGKLFVQEGNNDLVNGIINLDSFHWAQAAQALDLIKIQGLEKALVPPGRRAIPLHTPFRVAIVIELTEKGKVKNQYRKSPNAVFHGGLFAVPLGKTTVQKIFRNQEMKRGADEYRLVYFSYDMEWNELFLSLAAERQKAINLFNGKCAHCESGERYSPKRKGIVLLKHDPFNNQWSAVASDLGNDDADVQPRNVNRFLQGLPQ